MSGIELLNYLQGLSEEVLDKFIIVTHPNGGRSTLDHASVMYVGHLELHLSPEPTEEETNLLRAMVRGARMRRLSAAGIREVPLYDLLRLACNPEYRLCGRSFRTAMANAFFCPISTTSFFPRVIPV
jgi:hypothetical protein